MGWGPALQKREKVSSALLPDCRCNVTCHLGIQSPWIPFLGWPIPSNCEPKEILPSLGCFCQVFLITALRKVRNADVMGTTFHRVVPSSLAHYTRSCDPTWLTPQWEAEPTLLPFKNKAWKFHVSFLHISMNHSLGHTRTIRLKVTGAIIREGRSGCWGRQNCIIIPVLGASQDALTVTLTHLLWKLTAEHSFLIVFFTW